MTVDTILHRLHENGRSRANVPAYYIRTRDHWVPTTWKEYLEEVRQAAKALVALGFKKGQGVCILGFNRPEWSILDLGGLLAGGHATGIYTSNSPQEVQYIVHHSEATFVLVENEAQWQKINEVREQLPKLKHVILMKGANVDDELVLDWESFMAVGNDVSDEEIDKRLNSLEPGQLAQLIYTSGTTGPPKGVMLSHNNIAWTAKMAIDLLGITASDYTVSYLPLSHIAEQMFTIHAAITAVYQVYYAQFPPAEHLNNNFKEVQPTLVFGVPRVWERFCDGVKASMAEATGAKAKIANWALGVGAEAAKLTHQGKEPTGLLKIQHNLAEKLVFSKVKEGLGLNRAKFCITAAAPISPDIIKFFNSVNIPMFELYGQSEDCGPTTTNLPHANKVGTVGRKMPGSQVLLDEDGEIMVEGPHVFQGYFKDPAATEAALYGGRLHSGDLGQFDEDGYLTIVGRKKEIIITSGGKNIAPKNIEAALKNIPLVSQAVVIGEKRRYITALITLDPVSTTQFANKNNITGTVHDDPKLIAFMQKNIDEKVNPLFARVEQVRDFRILPRDFTVEEGELTPTLKIKRRIINEHFEGEIESMYEGG
ncbi:MAG: long-chain fatty acid--CoA ligase [Chloroflexi bacterium]|nr:MAG: long-chain fatty acid--CoA ligase [Chloroflexota bacterium]